MGRGARVTREEVAEFKKRAAKLEAVRAKDPWKYPRAAWDYLADQSDRPVQTIMRILQGYYDPKGPDTDRRGSLESDRPDSPPKSSRPQTDGGDRSLGMIYLSEVPDKIDLNMARNTCSNL